MEDKIIEKLVEMDAKIDGIDRQMATKDDLRVLNDTMMTSFDQQGVILQRLDQERLFTLERIKRIEADVEKMKDILQIA